MIKILIRILTIFLAVLCSLFGCVQNVLNTSGLTKYQETVTNYYLANLIDCIERKDKEGVKSLFSPEVNLSDDSIEELFEYYQGKCVETNDSHAYLESKNRSEGITHRWVEGAYIITTDEEIYHICMGCLVEDSEDQECLGIIYLYIINDKDYYPDDSVYRGYTGIDNYIPGINIGDNPPPLE